MRGEELSQYSFLQFVQDTWEADHSPKSESSLAEDSGPLEPIDQILRTSQNRSRAGRVAHARSHYLPAHPKHKKRVRVVRAPGHNTLPNIVGPFIERGDRPETYDLHCASILALLKPWRTVADLLLPGCSWSESLATFKASASRRELQIISGVDFHYQSREAALDDSQMDGIGDIAASAAKDNGLPDAEEQVEGEFDAMLLGLDSYQSTRPSGEVLHGQIAVDLGQKCGLLHRTDPSGWEHSQEPLINTSSALLQQVELWKSALTMQAAAQRAARTQPDSVEHVALSAGGSITLDGTQSSEGLVYAVTQPPPSKVTHINVNHLNSDQRRAYNIIQAHLLAQDSSSPPPQLLMQIQGEGGTGKSTVIKAVSELFSARNMKQKLFRAAPTGIAASLIDGSTLHMLCHMGVRRTSTSTNFSDKIIQALRTTWDGVQYLIIDEISMVSRTFLSQVSARLCVAKGLDPEASDTPFGGINVILAGDFHQFPPVAGGASAALYWPCNPAKDSHYSILGRKIYEQFRTVVVLTEQCRTKDIVWQGVLHRLRHGKCTADDIAILRSLIVSAPPSATEINTVQGDLWQNAILVTPRHEVRIQWNKEANRRHCQRNNKQLFISPAEDTYCGRALTEYERLCAATKRPSAGRDDFSGKNGLPEELELAVGMQVMITTNVETELDMANGSRGVIQRIIFDQRENIENQNDAVVRLAFPPECILIKLDRPTGIQLSGLECNVVPVVPFERRYTINAGNGTTKSITRRQIPLTSAYAFTDYRSQGQTMNAAIVDIGRPPTGKITPFNAYVALSRSSGRDTIRLLRNFDETLFTNVPCHKLAAEDKRLQKLNAATMREYKRCRANRECSDSALYQNNSTILITSIS